jgi:hypothetical protein
MSGFSQSGQFQNLNGTFKIDSKYFQSSETCSVINFKFLKLKAFPAGFGPATYGLEDRCSSAELRERKVHPAGVEPALYFTFFFKYLQIFFEKSS